MNVLFVGGGTAGHINPAIAIAEEFKNKVPDVNILFIGREGGGENELITKSGFKYETLKIRGIKRSPTPDNVKRIIEALEAKRTAGVIIDKFKPDAIIGTGGYVCWPVISEGARKGIKTFIHESNTVPGLTTKLLEKKCNTVFLNFEITRSHLSRRTNVEIVGNPLRKGFQSVTREEARKKLALKENDIQILSFGGSIGAEKLNSVLIEVMRQYSAQNKHIHHLHATGKKYYRKKEGIDTSKQGTKCRIVPYIDDMPTFMMASDIVISRCGAMTLSEIAASGVSAILIPSPNVTNNHQYKNAKHLCDKGAALMLEEKDLNREALLEKIRMLVNNKQMREDLGKRIKEYHVNNSEKKIVNSILKTISMPT